MMYSGTIAACATPLSVLMIAVMGCQSTHEPTDGSRLPSVPPEARWVVRSALGPGNSFIQDLTASSTSYVVGGAIDLIVYDPVDGSVRWKRSDVAARRPNIVDDSLLVMLIAGQSAGVRLRDGSVVWRATVAGAASSYQPVVIGRLGIVTGFDGEVSSIDVYTGVTRLLGAPTTLLGDAVARITGFAVTGDTLLVIGQVQPGALATEFGPIIVAMVDPGSGVVRRRFSVPIRPRDQLGNFRPIIHEQTLLLPTLGGVIAVDRTTGALQWRDSSSSVGDPVVRDGRIYIGDGIGVIVERDIVTGALVRMVRTNTAAIGALYPCREGIFFNSGSLWRLPRDSDRAFRVYGGEGFADMVRNGSTLYSNAVDVEVALRCT